MKNKIVVGATLFALAGTFSTGLFAKDEKANKDEAIAMVKKGVAFIKANGKDKGYTEIVSKTGQFTDRDLYLTVTGMDGTVRAHGANEKMVGKNLLDLKDIEGKAFVQAFVNQAKTNNSFWEDYKFTNPLTKKIEPKSMYCEKLDDTIVCGGIYK